MYSDTLVSNVVSARCIKLTRRGKENYRALKEKEEKKTQANQNFHDYLLPGSHVYVECKIYIHLFEMLRSRDRSIAVRSSRKNFSSSFDQSLRLVNFSVLLRVELIRLRCSVSLSILKVTVLRKLCFTAKTIVLYTSPIAI